MKQLLTIVTLLAAIIACDSPQKQATASAEPSTYCNPLDLSYRFMVDKELLR